MSMSFFHPIIFLLLFINMTCDDGKQIKLWKSEITIKAFSVLNLKDLNKED